MSRATFLSSSVDVFEVSLFTSIRIIIFPFLAMSRQKLLLSK